MADAHPITISPATGRVRVTFAGKTLAETDRALLLKEASMAPVVYVPREDANMAMLIRTAHSTHCPYKGDASYYTISEGGRTADNAVWTYETPKDSVAAIANHLAFYPNKVDAIEIA